MVRNIVFVLGLASSVAILSCGKKKSTEQAQQEVTDAINNALALGYPTGLSIPTFPKTTTASALTDDDTLNLEDTDTKGQTLKQKADDAKKILEGSVDDCFANLKKRAGFALPQIDSCYEFDQEMIYGWRDNANQLKGTNNGLSQKTDTAGVKSNEVCMVSFARDEMKEIESMIDQALDRAQVMACLGKKANKNPPSAVGDKVDLAGEIQAKAAADGKAPTFSEVYIKRLDDKETRPVYETKIVTTKGAQTEDVTIWHSPASATDNNTYNGVIMIKRTGGQSNDPNGTGMTQTLSINYARSDESGVKKIKASMRRARFASTYTTLFDTDGNVNFDGLATDAQNTTVNGIGLVDFDMNETDGTGSMSYWRNPGGNYNESARGFVFKIEKDTTTSLLKGCAISGAVNGVSIRKSLKEATTANELKPNSWYHPFFYKGAGETNTPETGFSHVITRTNGGQTTQGKWNKPDFGTDAAKVTLATNYVENQTGNYVSRQCFKQDTTSGAYVLDTAQITGNAGYELIETTSPNFIAPPNLKTIRERKMK